MTSSYFSFWYLISERFNVESRKAPTISFREVMHFFPGLTLVWYWLCWAVGLSDQTAESEVTVGCARPVNLLKPSPTLSTLNFRTCDRKINQIKNFGFFSWISLFNDDKFYNIPFVGFLRRSTRWKEVSDGNIYPQQALISGPQHREAWSVSPTDIPVAEYAVSSPLKSRPTPVRIWLLRLTVVVIVKPSL